jgi:hypothetical protein
MGERTGPGGSAHGTLTRLSSGLWSRVRVERADACTLVIAHASLPWPDVPGAGRRGSSFGLSLGLLAGSAQQPAGDGPRLLCDSAELPFVDSVFRGVTLYHVIGEGGEAELAEACRVLAPGGDLLVVGLNHCGWAGFDSGVCAGVPRLHSARVQYRLRELGMIVEARLGAGLFGRERPAVLEHGWQRLAVAVADVVLLRARHLHRPAAARPNLKEIPAGLAPTAITSH